MYKYITFVKSSFYFIIISAIVFVIHDYISTAYYHLIPSLFYFAIPVSLAVAFMLLFTPLMIFIAKKTNFVSNPKPRNEKNKPPTPLLGGAAVYLAFICTIFTFTHHVTDQIKSIIIGGSVIALIGTIDDIHPLSSTVRIIGQVSAAFIVMLSGLIVSFTPNSNFGNILSILITLIWILGITNATNFLDGADGLAAGIAAISSIFFFLITLHLQQQNVALVSSIVAGCCAGFLLFNFKPAKIYLGDGGSTFLGFVLACIALYGGWSNRGAVIALGVPVIILGVLIFDMIYITAARINSGKVRSFQQWLDYTGKDHFHHRLMHLGFDEKYAVLFIYLLCIVLGLGALTIENAKVSYPMIIQLINATLIFVLIIMLMLVGRQTTVKK